MEGGWVGALFFITIAIEIIAIIVLIVITIIIMVIMVVNFSGRC